jgi:hypothetical protein
MAKMRWTMRGGEAFVGDEQQVFSAGGQVRVAIQHGGQHVAFVDFGAGQCPARPPR